MSTYPRGDYEVVYSQSVDSEQLEWFGDYCLTDAVEVATEKAQEFVSVLVTHKDKIFIEWQHGKIIKDNRSHVNDYCN